ncbi:hypothetical protein PUW24_22080 [Paenibacillus urinalis]|uniref:Uncharacterized protein n=1 Tax=Paenibacillus urinalis TaxID=521520 RepID=A0AAX3MT13_9BACL|nr:hypothetical protein [Paenibacillus urinalis]WDH80755.1 hypothetical protein PUW23_14485 [Paenibacillus urinalis]WDH96808.1 hypothetical protein PUW24_22080 [Paenibacillus urinalis]WDI00451.1 hypothetical protein PUW25_14230 [Paenibacillus urinalis]
MLKKNVKRIGLLVFILMIGSIILNFYLNYFTIAYALMGVLLLFISGWGAVVKVKNDVNMDTDQYKRNTYENDIDRYTR